MRYCRRRITSFALRPIYHRKDRPTLNNYEAGYTKKNKNNTIATAKRLLESKHGRQTHRQPLTGLTISGVINKNWIRFAILGRSKLGDLDWLKQAREEYSSREEGASRKVTSGNLQKNNYKVLTHTVPKFRMSYYKNWNISEVTERDIGF